MLSQRALANSCPKASISPRALHVILESKRQARLHHEIMPSAYNYLNKGPRIKSGMIDDLGHRSIYRVAKIVGSGNVERAFRSYLGERTPSPESYNLNWDSIMHEPYIGYYGHCARVF